ncbi:isoprenyl transferase [Demequina sp.]|uniref:isoprenyl transferase n=1 Tax=Demequina sp. TaxID=2050685 RepID=UPI0025BA1B29|nr:isoprenyl transferase [Demequina sp.]
MGIREAAYRGYEALLTRDLRARGSGPCHIGVILDGNRRWAKLSGASAAHGHQRGADKITEVLEWSQESGVEVVTLWMLSTDNLGRDGAELGALLEIIVDAVERLARDGRWRLQHVGDSSLLPAEITRRLNAAVDSTKDASALHVNVAVGYGGRHEIADAVRSFLLAGVAAGHSLEEVAEQFSVEHIAAHLYTKGQPDPDLVIRTSGEQRLSGFLMWQSAHTEFYFCDAYWPDFRRVDFLRALRSYAQRERRRGR